MAKPFVGTWNTQWRSYDNNVQGSATLTVTESFLSHPSGEVLNGFWDAPDMRPGTLHGTLSQAEDTWIWSGEWWVSPAERGGFEFKLDSDSDEAFRGTYNAINRTEPAQEEWNGTLMRRHVDS
jgi:hypothetical protein